MIFIERTIKTDDICVDQWVWYGAIETYRSRCIDMSMYRYVEQLLLTAPSHHSLAVEEEVVFILLLPLTVLRGCFWGRHRDLCFRRHLCALAVSHAAAVTRGAL